MGAAELALRAHGFDGERLMKLARKVASDTLRARGAVLGDRFEDLVSRLQLVGLKAALDFDATRSHVHYGTRGGDPFVSYVSDVMERRVTDFFRSKSEGFGDRRYGNDGRLVLTAETDEDADPDVDFGKLISEKRLAYWQSAARSVELEMSEWIVIVLDRAARQVLRTAA